jgi:uncharacterized repeat protein (TIGR01451 family)
LTDPFAGGATLTSGDIDRDGVLDVGEVWIYSADYNATQADINAGTPLINIAIVDTDQTEPQQDDATTTITIIPAISIVKTVNLTEISAPTTLTYTITVTNTGNVSLTGVTLTDPFAGGAILTSGDNDRDGVLDVGEAWIYNAIYTATQDHINAGTPLVNIAFVDTDQTGVESDDATTTIRSNPAMSVVKVVDIATISAPATLTYRITVTNTGNVSLTNVVLTDDLAGPATLISGDDGDRILEVGEAWVYTATFNATQRDIDNGTDIVNVAIVDTDQTGPQQDDAMTVIDRRPALTITKTVNTTTISAPGTLNYTITVVNTGNVSLTGVVLTDALAPATLTSDGDGDNALEVGETWIYSAAYTVTQAQIDAGNNIVNVAIVDTDQTVPQQDDAVTVIDRRPALTITKTVNLTTISAPGTLTYTITITNTGNVSLTGVVLTDDLAGGAVLTSSGDGDSILEVGETWIYTATYNATQNDIDEGDDLINTASVETDQTDEEDATATTTIDQSPGISIEKTVDLTSISSPVRLTYTITIRNTGNVSLTDVVVNDDLAEIAIFISGDTDSDGELDVNEVWIYSAVYDVTQDDIDEGEPLVNTASVSTDEISSPESDDASTTISSNPGWSMSKVVAETEYVNTGDVLHYTITVDNTGNVSISNVRITDPGADTGSIRFTGGDTDTDNRIDPSETWTFSATHTVTQDDIDAGSYTNTATANGNAPSDTMTPATGSATVPALQLPELEIVKSTDAVDYVHAGEVITYTLTITNTGNVTITGITVSDPNATTITCTGAPYTLRPGQTATCTATHLVTLADVLAGEISNTATVTGTAPSTDPVSDNSNTVTIPLRNLPPSINCPVPVIASTSQSTCDALITGTEAVFSDPNDNVDRLTWTMTGATVATSPATGINQLTSHTFNRGVTTVTYTVTDALGLSASCSFTVTVNDNTPPVAICRDIDVYLDLNTGVVTITPDMVNNNSFDNCAVQSIAIDRNTFDCTNLGANTVTLTVTDESGNTSICTSVVTVHYAVIPVPVVTPASLDICDEGTTSFVLTNNLPATTWTWTVTSPASVTGASADNTGTLSSIIQTLDNSSMDAQRVTYTVTPRVYGACTLAPVTAEVWVNPKPEIRAVLADTIACSEEPSLISVRNPNGPDQGPVDVRTCCHS